MAVPGDYAPAPAVVPPAAPPAGTLPPARVTAAMPSSTCGPLPAAIGSVAARGGSAGPAFMRTVISRPPPGRGTPLVAPACARTTDAAVDRPRPAPRPGPTPSPARRR